MMRSITSVLAVILFVTALPLAGQVTYDELEFEMDSITRAYKAKGRNYAYIRSKRGTSGVNKNNRADSITTLTINEIVLVYTEMNKGDRAERTEANRERWENLLKTYPEYFDYSPTLITLCQCNFNGDSVAFKKQQGFYVYFEGDESAAEPPAEEAKVAVVAAPAVKAATKAEPKREESKKQAEEPKKQTEEPVAEKKKKVKEPEVEETPVVKAEEPVVEKKKKEKKTKEKDPLDDITMDLPEEAKTKAPKKTGYSKPRRATDPKACRPACYENGEEDLNAFFKDNITLTKKQKKKAKNWTSSVRLQLNFDGSIKKSTVTGTNPDFNKMVEGAVANMNLWNPSVKNGVTIKSDVRMTLKYDKESKSIKPFDVTVMPRLAAKCKCVSDAEIFGN